MQIGRLLVSLINAAGGATKHQNVALDSCTYVHGLHSS